MKLNEIPIKKAVGQQLFLLKPSKFIGLAYIEIFFSLTAGFEEV